MVNGIGRAAVRLVRGALLLSVALLLGSALPAAAAPPSLPPSPTHYVTDKAGVLSPAERSSFEARLAGFEDETSNQFLIYVEPKIPEGTTLEEYAAACFKAWGVGQRQKKNGLVLFVFPQSRAARFEVGYGLEGALPDALAGRILEQQVLPHFKEGNFGSGIEAGVTAAIEATKGEYKGTGRRPVQTGRRGRGFPWGLLLFLLFFILPAVFGRRRSPYWFIGGGGFGSGGFGGFGGGGGGFSGGGGWSGGGGASGRW
jgi:uncharacterized protein